MDLQEYILNESKKTGLSEKLTDQIFNLTLFNLSRVPYFNKDFDFLFLTETEDGQLLIKNNKLHNKKGFTNDTLNNKFHGIFRSPESNKSENEDYEDYFDEDHILSKIKTKTCFISEESYNNIKEIINLFEKSKTAKEFSITFSKIANEFPEKLCSFFYHIDTINNNHYQEKIFKEFIHNESGKIKNKFDSYYITKSKDVKDGAITKLDSVYELSNRDISINTLKDPKTIFSPEDFSPFSFLSILNVERSVFFNLKENDSEELRRKIFKENTLNKKGEILFSKNSPLEKINIFCEEYYKEKKDELLKEIMNDFSKYTYKKPKINKAITNHSNKILSKIINMYPELNNKPENIINDLEFVYKDCPLQQSYPKTELAESIIHENKLHFITEDYETLRDSNYRDLGQFAVSLNKEWDKICFYMRTKNAHDIVGGINFVYEKDKPKILSSPSVGISYNFRGLKLAEKLYTEFVKGVEKRQQIVFSTMYTAEGSQKLPKLKSRIQNKSDNIIFLNADPSGTFKLEGHEDKFLQHDNNIAEINKYVKHFLVTDTNHFNYQKFQDSYKNMINYFKEVSKNIKKDDYMALYTLREDAFNNFKQNYEKKLKNKLKP